MSSPVLPRADSVFEAAPRIDPGPFPEAPFAVFATNFGAGLAFRAFASRWLAETVHGCLTFVAVRGEAAPAEVLAARIAERPEALPEGFDRTWLDALPPPHRGFFLLRVIPGRVHLLLLQDDVAAAIDALVGPVHRVLDPENRLDDAALRNLQTRPAPVPSPRQVTIVGAGLAGACVARALADHHIDVRIVDRGPPPGEEAPGTRGSTNPWLLCRPHLAAGPDPLAALTQAGWQLRSVYGPALDPLRSFVMGPREGKLAGHHRKILDRWRASPWIDPVPAGLPLTDGYRQTAAARIDGPRAIAHLLAGLDVRWQTTETEARSVVWATGAPPPSLGLTTHAIAGSTLRAPERVLPLGLAMARGRYLIDDPHGTILGATRHRGSMPDDDGVTLIDDVARWFGLAVSLGPIWQGTRAKSPDHLPIVGIVDGAGLTLGHGSKGSVTAPIAAALLEAQWLGLPWPVPRGVARALDPTRSRLRTQ